MKKSFSFFKGAAFNKLGFLPFLMTFLFFAAMQVDMKAQTNVTNASQSSQSVRSLYTVPTGSFVSPQVAQERILNAMKALKDQLAQYAEGTAPYEAAFLTYKYYSYIQANLEAGKGVADSIQAADSMITADLSIQVTPEEALVERNAAINLLRP
jgi:hypothetical protein